MTPETGEIKIIEDTTQRKITLIADSRNIEHILLGIGMTEGARVVKQDGNALVEKNDSGKDTRKVEVEASQTQVKTVFELASVAKKARLK